MVAAVTTGTWVTRRKRARKAKQPRRRRKRKKRRKRSREKEMMPRLPVAATRCRGPMVGMRMPTTIGEGLPLQQRKARRARRTR